MFTNYKKIIKYFFYSFIIFLIFSAIYFGYIVHSSYIRADEWRFIDLFLYPIQNNTFNMSLLWSDHHPQPLTVLLFICSEKYFGLTVNLYFYTGMIGKVLFIILFIYLVKKTLKTNLFNMIGIVLITSTFLSLKSVNEYAWPLVTLSNIWNFIFLVIALYADKSYQSNSKKDYIILYFLISFSLVFVKDSTIINVMGLYTILILVMLYDRKYSINSILVLICSLMTYKLIYMGIGMHQIYTDKIILNISSLNLLDLLNSYSIAISSGLINFHKLKHIGFGSIYSILFSYLIFINYIGVFIFYMKNKLYKKTLIPPILMMATIFFITAIIVYRFPPINHNIINWRIISPRYIKIYEIGIIAMLWALLVIVENAKLVKIKKILYVVFSILIIINIYYIYNSWIFSKFIIKTNENAKKMLLNYKNGEKNKLPIFLKGKYFSEDKLIFLKRNNLNVFNAKERLK